MADYDLELDLQTRPLDDIIEEIARDLNVNAQERSWRHKRRTPNHPSRPPPPRRASPSPPGRGTG